MVLIPIEIESLLRLMEAQCPFCNVPASRIWFDSKHSLAFLDPDKRRICLMGLSMGGFGTWSLAAAHPARFAAIVPICGGGDPADAKKLAALPIRVFHGAKDPTVPVQRSREMVEAIKAAGGNFKFTEYREAEHDCWTETYDNPELYRWLLPQKR